MLAYVSAEDREGDWLSADVAPSAQPSDSSMNVRALTYLKSQSWLQAVRRPLPSPVLSDCSFSTLPKFVSLAPPMLATSSLQHLPLRVAKSTWIFRPGPHEASRSELVARCALSWQLLFAEAGRQGLQSRLYSAGG